MSQNKIYRVAHEEPNDFRWDYILLPYGQYYEKTAAILSARPGDTLRFFEGRDAEIKGVRLIEDEELCGILSRTRYGLPWPVVFDQWRRDAILEGHSGDVLLPHKCIFVAFTYKCEEKQK